MSTATPTKVFSLAAAREVAVREDKGAKVFLRDELGEPLMTTDAEGNPVQAEAVVVGKLSSTYRKASQSVDDNTLKRRAQELTAELLETNELTKIAKCVKSWNLRDGKTPIPCDTANLITVMLAAPWIRADFEKAMNDPARFL